MANSTVALGLLMLGGVVLQPQANSSGHTDSPLDQPVSPTASPPPQPHAGLPPSPETQDPPGLVPAPPRDGSPPLPPRSRLLPNPAMEGPMSDLSESVLTPEVFELVETLLNTAAVNVVCVLGVLGNALTLCILWQHGFRSSTNILLFSLAVADLLIVLVMPLRKIALIIERFDRVLASTVESHIVRYQLLTLVRVWSLISNSHVAVIAVERMLAVYFPLKVSLWVTPGRMAVGVVIVHVTWYIAMWPNYTMFQLHWLPMPDSNRSVAVLEMTEFYFRREDAFNLYNSFVVNLVFGGVLLAITFVCCSMVSWRIVRVGKERIGLISADSDIPTRSTSKPMISSSAVVEETDKTDSSQQDQAWKQKISSKTAVKKNLINFKVVRMLMWVCLVYLVFVCPMYCLQLCMYVFEELRQPAWVPVNFIATSVAMLCSAINSSVNFIIYMLGSNKFYSSFMAMLSCGRGQGKVGKA